MMIIWILFGLIELSRTASITENTQLVGLIGYFTQPTKFDGGNFNVSPIVFYPILQKMANSYLPRDREAVEAMEQGTIGTESVTDLSDKIGLTTVAPLSSSTSSSILSDIPPINGLPLGESSSAALLAPPNGLSTTPPTIPLPSGPYSYGYSNSNQDVDSITFTTSYPPPIVYPLNTPSQLYQFRPSPLQTNQFNHFRPSHFELALPDGNTNFITGKSRLDNFPFDILG